MFHGPEITAAQAKSMGMTRYSLAKPCPHGHFAWRRLQDHYCMECRKVARRTWKRSPAGRHYASRIDKEKRARKGLYSAVINARQCTNDQFRTISHGVKDIHKPNRTTQLSGVALKIHFTHLFQEGMSWDNYGEAWHVDHIRPSSSFDLNDPQQFKLCFSWWNLQPLFPEQNLEKSDLYGAEDELDWVVHIDRFGYRGDFHLVYS